MKQRLIAGLVAGFIAGVLSALTKQFSIVEVRGGSYPLIYFVAWIFGCDSLACGWLLQVAFCSIAGTMFGALHPAAWRRKAILFSAAVVYGLLIWFAGGVIIAPLVLNVPRESFVAIDAVCWLVFGVTLGIGYCLFDNEL